MKVLTPEELSALKALLSKINAAADQLPDRTFSRQDLLDMIEIQAYYLEKAIQYAEAYAELKSMI